MVTVEKKIIHSAGDWDHWQNHFREALKKPIDRVGETIVLETPFFRVWSIHLKPKISLPFHKHVYPYFWTCHSEGKARSYYSDGSIIEFSYKINDVGYFDHLSKKNCFIHNLENIGDTTLIFTTMEFLKPFDPSSDIPPFGLSRE